MSVSTFIDVRGQPLAGADEPHGLPSPALTWGIFVVSVTAILLGSFVGSAGAYAFLALWIMLALPYGRRCMALLTDCPLALWALPFLALASTVWSQSRPDTLKYGLEFVATAGCAVLAASLLKPRALISALTCCLVITAVLSVVFGKESVDPLTGSSAFVGVFESKNQLGFFTSLMLLAAVALLIDSGQPLPARLLGVRGAGAGAAASGANAVRHRDRFVGFGLPGAGGELRLLTAVAFRTRAAAGRGGGGDAAGCEFCWLVDGDEVVAFCCSIVWARMQR